MIQPDQHTQTLNHFVLSRTLLAFAILLLAVGMAGYVLVARPVLDKYADSLASRLLPGPDACQPDSIRRLQPPEGMTVRLTNSSALPDTRHWPALLPFDALLARRIQQRAGTTVVTTSSLHELQLAFHCQEQTVILDIDRAHALGTVPNVALLFWLFGLLGGALVMAAILSRALGRPLARLAGHLRATPLGMASPAAAGTGIAELDALAAEVDALRQRASSAVATRTALLMGLSHDLRAPLARLRLILDTVGQPTSDDMADLRHDVRELQDALDEFMRAANAMASPSSVGGAREGWQRLQRIYTSARISFAGVPDDRCPPLNTAALVRIASHLIDNAICHTDGAIQILWHSAADWQLCVRDEGRGIDDSAFHPFHSGDSGHSNHAGLGLALASLICEHNGWQLSHGHVDDNHWQICISARPNHPAGS